MDYEAFAERAEKEGRSENLTPTLHQWKEEGDHITGKFISRREVPSGLGEGVFFMYVFDTREGRVIFALGAGVDASVGDQFRKDGVYTILYNGKTKTNRGFNANDFKVTFYGLAREGAPYAETDASSKDDIPF